MICTQHFPNLIFHVHRSAVITCRTMSSISTKALVLGFHEKEESGFALTSTASAYDKQCNGELSKQLSFVSQNAPLRKGTSFKFFGLEKNYFCVHAVNLGKEGLGYDEQEQMNLYKENVRAAIAGGCRSLRDLGSKTVEVDTCGDPEAAAEGCTLGLYSFDELKKPSSRKKEVNVVPASFEEGRDDAKWRHGLLKAQAQNVARRLMDSPANHMTPKIFSENIEQLFAGKENVKVFIRDKKWAEVMKMNSYLSVAQGSDQPPYFVEVHYNGGPKDQKPLALVGKGITFDSGGICLKPRLNMDAMRADMGGAACVMGATYAAVNLNIPINIVALTPMSENLPNGSATKPGDVFTAMNGKTIQVDNTDAEGRLVLADALVYAHTFEPRIILDMATLTGGAMIALGGAASALFTNDTKLFELLHEAGKETGDRVWRMPLFQLYTKHATDSDLADVNNKPSGRGAFCCTAAAFLKEFVAMDSWVHLDIASVMEHKDEVPYLCKGMAGRPTRTIVEFIKKLSTL